MRKRAIKRLGRRLNPTKDRAIYARMRTCELKVKYQTPELALANTTQCAYKCPYCDGYHRTSIYGYLNLLVERRETATAPERPPA